MSILQIFTDVQLVNRSLTEAGVVRIPFTPLNNSLIDIISVYTSSVLSFAEHAYIRQALVNEPSVLNVESSSLYIFRRQNYKLFLQMSANEDVVTHAGTSKTVANNVLFSSGSSGSLSHCPIYTENDAALFSSIEHSPYAGVLPSSELHLLKVESKIHLADDQESNIVEYLLYVP